MPLISPKRVFNVSAFAILFACVGCGGSSTVSSDKLLKLGLEKLDAKLYDEAIELFTELAEKSPTATNHALIGDCYWVQVNSSLEDLLTMPTTIWQRKLEEADIHYRKALEIDPKHCGANHALGRDAVLLKRYQNAIPYLDAANELCAGSLLHAQNLRFRVEAFLELDKIAEAEVDMERLLSEYPENANTYKAGVLVATKKGDEALAAEYQAKLDAHANDQSR